MAAEEMSGGEIRRTFDRIDKQYSDMQRQITDLARETVSSSAFAQALAVLRQDQAEDRAQAELLAQERHRAVLARLKNLETVNSTRPMNTWAKFAIVSASVLGLLTIAVTFYVGTHH